MLLKNFVAVHQSLREACAILGFLCFITFLVFTIKVTIVHVAVYILRLPHLMSQLISSYVFCMILAKFIELRTHLIIFDYS